MMTRGLLSWLLAGDCDRHGALAVRVRDARGSRGRQREGRHRRRCVPHRRGLAVRDGSSSPSALTTEVRAHDRAGHAVDRCRRDGPSSPASSTRHVHALDVAAAEAAQPFATCGRSPRSRRGFERGSPAPPPGTWIWTPRVFPTRLREHRFPTRQELDAASPRQPSSSTAPTPSSLNTAALARGRHHRADARSAGRRDRRDDRRRAHRVCCATSAGCWRASGRRRATPCRSTDSKRVHRRYLATGITSVIERGATLDGYRHLRSAASRGPAARPRDASRSAFRRRPTPPRCERFIRGLPFRFDEGDDWLKVGPLKIVADGGILIGTSFMREPYGAGARPLYGVDDRPYRGFLTLTPRADRGGFAAGIASAGRWSRTSPATPAWTSCSTRSRRRRKRAPAPDRRHTLIHAYFVHPETASARGAARRARGHPARLVLQGRGRVAGGARRATARALHRPADVARRGRRRWRSTPITCSGSTRRGDEPVQPVPDDVRGRDAAGRSRARCVSGDEAVTREDALRMMTIDAARFSFDESEPGIDRGRQACRLRGALRGSAGSVRRTVCAAFARP